MGPPRPRPIRSASVLMPTWQGLEFLARLLDALAAQRADFPWDVHVIDSGSTDGTVELLEARRATFPVPFHVARIPSVEFDHGDTRNQLAQRSAGDLLVYLTQDAIPSDDRWLARLARNFEDPAVGAAYCRNVPRADAKVLTKVMSRNDPGYATERAEVRLPDAATLAAMDPDERRRLYNFNDVASAIRRELWELHPFPRTTMGEDVLIGRAILEAGYTVVYDAEATVDHSHDYGPEKMRWRGQVDGRFNAEWMERVCVGGESDIAVLTDHLVGDDVRVLRELGTAPDDLARLESESRLLRGAIVRGLYEGGLSPRRYPRSTMRDRRDVRVLLVAHDAPPATTGGAEERAANLELAHSLHSRGHRVTVLSFAHAEPSAGDRGKLRLRREDQRGVAVLRATDPLQPAALEAAFRGVLACEQPDLVHFLTLRAASLEMVRAACELELATVANLDRGGLHEGRAAMIAAALVDLRLCADADVRKAWLAAGEFDPMLLAFTERGGLAGSAKTVAEEAAELEYRYRALCSIVRANDADRPFLAAAGSAARTSGPAVRQGPDWILLRPGSSAEFDLAGMKGGTAILELEQYVLAAETEVVLAGRALVDGASVGRFAPVRSSGRDEVVRQTLECRLAEGARVLRLETGFEDREGRAFPSDLRVCRVSLTRPRAAEPADRTRGAPPPADLARLFEELRVVPGPPVERARLPRVAIVIPNLDGREVLEDCLASVAALDYERERIEVLLVDNGSTDGSLELVRERFPSVRVVRHERNLGFAAACNAGARAARDAQVVAFLNNDMRFERDFLRELVAPLVRRECAATTAKILGWDGRTIDTSGTGTTFLGIAVQPGYGAAPRPEHDVPRRTLFACGGAMAIDAAVLRDVGGFDEEYFAYYEDLDLGWRMWVQGHEIRYVPTALCRHRHSHTSNRFPPEVVRLVMIRNSLYTCVKNYDDANLARVLPAMLALAIRRAHLKSGLDEAPFRIETARVDAPRTTVATDTVPIGKTGAADLIAIDDLLADWDHWMRRRREVQSRRKRGDDEIQRLFLEPLACVEGDAAYARLQAGLVALFGLGDTFRRA